MGSPGPHGTRAIRLGELWLRARTSLWFLPSICTLLAIVLAFVTVWIDRSHAPGTIGSFWFVFQTGAEGARGILSTIAGSLMTVTGVVFSITIVVLQLASSQFTPRVLRTFTEDRANHLVLGIFIGTFSYSLLVMRSVRSRSDDYGSFVPVVSVTVAVILALLSIGVLIFFIHHVAHSIRVEVILERVKRDALGVVKHLFPEGLSEPAGPAAPGDWSPDAGAPVAVITAWRGGYIQSVDIDLLLAGVAGCTTTVIMTCAVGDFMVEGDVLARAWPPHDGRTSEVVKRAIQIGPERTRHQDVERGIMELADIGIRALSPSLNDPSTAITCIDHLTEVVTALGTRSFPSDARTARDGRTRLRTQSPSFDRLVRLAYRELRHHGSADPAVALRLASSLARVAARVPPGRRTALLAELREVASAATRELESAGDVRQIQERVDGALRSL